MGSYKRIISILLISILFIFSIIFLYNAVSGEGFRGGGGGRVGGFGRYGGRAIGAGVVGLGAERYYGGGRGWRSNYYDNSEDDSYGWIPWLWHPWHRLYSEEPVYYVPQNKVPYYPSSSYNYPYNNLQM